MGESRDANDPRDLLRAMRKEAQAEFEQVQAGDTGGQEHASRADREGIPADRRPLAAAARGSTRSARDQDDAGALRTPGGDAVTGGGGQATRGVPPQGPGDEPGDRHR